MQHLSIKSILAIAILVLIMFPQCKQQKATPVIESVVKTEKINASGITTVIAECPSGKQMVGGGYTITPDNPNIKINVRGSYPATKRSWEVDVLNNSGNNESPGSLTVYVYFYTGDKDPGMVIKSEEKSFNGPGPGVVNAFFSSGIAKPNSSDVVSSGGFKISTDNSTEDIAVVGSYPTIASTVGTIDNVSGWTNNFSVLQGKTGKITNYIVYSMGILQRPQNIPVFDQGAAIRKNFSGPTQGKIPSFEIAGNSDYFCTGGGYNLKSLGDAMIYPINVWQNNANTKPGIFFGWQFAGHAFGNFGQTSCDIYALQLKLH